MKYSSRFFLYAPVGAFLLLLAGLCLHWFWAADKLSDRLDALNGQTVMPGVTLRFAQKEMAGFPFRLDAAFKNLEITVETGNGLARWRSEEFAFHTLTFGRPQEVFEAAGKQTIDWTDDTGGAKTFEFVPGALRASAIEDEDGLTRFDLDLAGFGSAELQAGRMQFHIRKDGDAVQFVLSGETIQLSPRLSSAFGDTIKNLKLDGRISQAAAFEELRAGKADWRLALENWRAREGTLQLAPSEIAWDKVKMGASGALTLDDAKRLRGILDLKITGLAALIQEAEKRGALKGADKGLVAALLENIAQKAENKGELPVTLGLKDGFVYAEQTPVTTLKPLY